MDLTRKPDLDSLRITAEKRKTNRSGHNWFCYARQHHGLRR
jgi:hypothetical protein